MSKMRIYEYAKKHNVTSKEVITQLRELSFEVANHMAVLDDQKLTALDKQYTKAVDKSQTKPQHDRSSQPQQRQNNSGAQSVNKTNQPEQRQSDSRPQNQPEQSQSDLRPQSQPEQRQSDSRPQSQPERSQSDSRSQSQPEQRQSDLRSQSQPEQRQSDLRPQSQPEQRQSDSRPQSQGTNRPSQPYQKSNDSRPQSQGANRPSQPYQKPNDSRPQSQGANRPSQPYQKSNDSRPQSGDRPNQSAGTGRTNSQYPRPSGSSQDSRPQNRPASGQFSSQSRPNQQGQGNFAQKKPVQGAAKPVDAKPQQDRKSQYKPKTQTKSAFDDNAQRRKPTGQGARGRQAPVRKSAPKEMPKRKERELPAKITFEHSLTVFELAKKLGKEPSEIIKKLFLIGVMATINQSLDKDAIELICGDYGVEVEEKITIDETDFDAIEIIDAAEELTDRPPVVTIMGHVDHGKTTLLDSIRDAKVTAEEAGGITQHIGAYQVVVNDKKITFLDTPGHAAFTTMRARGAQITDIVILVVAADDGVMPQTEEAINHAKAAGVPIIVAVNKMDKPDANPQKIMQELSSFELVSEEWGGNTIFCNLSAKTGEGIDNLLEMILLFSEMQEYKANPNRRAIGTVVEAELDKGRGAVATLLVQAGTLKVGDPIVVGNTFGRVRAMVNEKGRRVKEATPSTPVEITGLNDVPQAGDRFVVFEDEKKARQIGEVRAQKQVVAQRNVKSKISLEDLFEHIKQGEIKEINIIVKADVQGSAEAMAASLQKIEVEGVRVKIVHTGVGAINEHDVMLASASSAIIVGFNVRPDSNAKRIAEEEEVDIRLHRIIYKVIEEIELAMKGMLDPEFAEKVLGQAEVRQLFKVTKVGTIAGSYVTEGKITRDSSIRLIREGIVVFEGEVDTLKRIKDDVKEVARGYECGIMIKNFNDMKEGDIIEAFIMEEIKRA